MIEKIEMKKKINIQLASHDACTGCAACASVCPTGSISMHEDKEGFLQPHIDADTCINCHKCEKTCPIVSPIIIPNDYETQAYAAINKDEAVRMRSSSGGMFHALAKWTIEQGGVVFGARFNDQWEVVHDYTETIKGIEPFMRSKYVQSRIGDTFKQAKQFLEQGRQVLFVGTPCQIGGLKTYLHKDFENLITIDIICHGVPSPKVWREYLKDSTKGDMLLDFNFRDKTKEGWLNYQCKTITTTNIKYERKMENPYFAGFMNNVYLRCSCYNCKFKQVHRKSDLTLADYWGVNEVCPHLFDNKGTSLVFFHTEKGLKFVRIVLSEGFVVEQQQINNAISHNLCMTISVSKPSRRNTFFRVFRICGFDTASYYIYKDSMYARVIRKISRLLKK